MKQLCRCADVPALAQYHIPPNHSGLPRFRQKAPPALGEEGANFGENDRPHPTKRHRLPKIIYLEKRFTSALKSFPTTLLQADSYVTLTELNTQPSIIASRVVPYLSQATLLVLPMTGLLSNLQIELLAPHSSESLHSAARRAYEGLDITSLQSLDDGISERAYSTKCLFYRDT